MAAERVMISSTILYCFRSTQSTRNGLYCLVLAIKRFLIPATFLCSTFFPTWDSKVLFSEISLLFIPLVRMEGGFSYFTDPLFFLRFSIRDIPFCFSSFARSHAPGLGGGAEFSTSIEHASAISFQTSPYQW